ncbi:MAG: hypothetical protein DSY80_08180 [Desulfocapsa sp.]|nr:MAG: hypothetical protein DSY80_08180 [Desulfocapsa sp.]
MEKSICREAKSNPKKFWNFIKGKLKTTTGVADLVKGRVDDTESLTKNDKEKAEVLAGFFSSVFTRESDTEVPTTPEKNFDRPVSTITITREKVQKKLEQLKIDKSQGPDKVHPRLLKELAEELSSPLTQIFNTSLNQGRLPTIWRRAQVTALFKKGSRKEPCNYRPVSLTCIACKILESIIRDHLMDHLKRNKLFSSRQYGFIGGRSTGLQMLKVLEKWTEILDRGGEIDVIYLDFMKAFDTVPHRRLLSKLSSYGIHGEVLSWIKAFLCDRRQRVAVRGSFSDWLDVLSGIPQGSVLWPLLFVLYINDLPDNMMSEVFMFADDTKVFREIKDDTDRATLQADLEELQTWSTKWLLKFHPDKCKTMTITRRKDPEARPYVMMKKVDGGDVEHILSKVDNEKDLGIRVDAKLSFEQHISDKINKANQMMGLVRRSFIYLDKDNFRWLYKAIVRPHLEYINAVWSPTRKKDINSIENVQRRATKMIPGLRDMSYSERLRALKLPTLVYRRLRGDMIETFKITHEIYDPEAAPLMSMAGPERSSARGHTFKMFKRRVNTRLRQNYFTERVIDVWNSLPGHVVEAPSIKAFERRLDRFWRNQDIVYDHEALILLRRENDILSPVSSDSDLDTQV